jgi:hypothetical protein
MMMKKKKKKKEEEEEEEEEEDLHRYITFKKFRFCANRNTATATWTNRNDTWYQGTKPYELYRK